MPKLEQKVTGFTSEEDKIKFAEWIMSYENDPYGWVLACYPWEEEGTPLEHYSGPDYWQKEVLCKIRDKLQAGEKNVRITVSSGHGVGKTALFAWICHWYISTHPNPQLVVTANTKVQLTTKTWRELAKWKNLAVNGFMFHWSATSYRLIGREDTWYASAIPWSAHNPDAFQGTHETNVMMVYDEASGIDDPIWVASEGAFTSHGGIWLTFGNCTRNSGRFYENTFGRSRHRWDRVIVDARTALMRSDELIDQWIEDWGIDSDFVRVRVLGLPPKQGDLQLIATDVVSRAVAREIHDHEISDRVPKVMAVDVARQGADSSKVVIRRGRKMSEKIWTFNERDTTMLSQYVSKIISDNYPDLVFVDGVGIGAGVVDMLRRMGHDNIIEVQAGSTPSDQKLYWNKRIEMWDRMRDWLEGADIPDDPQLQVDLTTPEYSFEAKSDRMKLESKDDMRARGCASPDTGDALAMTFYHLVPSKSQFVSETSYEPEVI
jgi:hypothetical protein